ncbi:MAG: hypothetical protein H6563_13655 [Lewinellaceae bacterium]|nr:hypothetical protein [Lewinellaceae bacterium]
MKNFFLLIGFIAAAWFTADVAMNKFGLRFQGTENTAFASLSSDFRSPGADRSAPSSTYREEAADEDVVLRFSREENKEYNPYDTYAKGAVPPVDRQVAVKPSKKASSPKIVNVNDWVDRFTSIAFLEAQNKDVHVPATLSLATGLHLIQQGERIDSKEDYINKVIDYLVGIKDKASDKDRKAYFQYAANTRYWLQGMERSGIPTAELKSLISHYNLDAFDEVVFESITKKQLINTKVTRIEPKTEKPVFVGDKTDKAALRKHADKVNQWAEEELAGSGYDMQFAAASESPSGVVAEVRKAVASLEVGESMVFDDPADYELAVKELVALESGFNSWKAYYMDQPSRAQKQFRDRHNLMSKGLKMRVTRQK